MESWWQHVMSPSRIVRLCQNLFANIYISNLKSRSKTPVVITSFNGTWKTFFEGFPRIRKSQAANCLPGLSSDVSLIRHVSRLSRFLPDKLYNYLEFSCSPLAGLMTLTGHIVSRADRRASKGISDTKEEMRMIIRGVELLSWSCFQMSQYDSTCSANISPWSQEMERVTLEFGTHPSNVTDTLQILDFVGWTKKRFYSYQHGVVIWLDLSL